MKPVTLPCQAFDPKEKEALIAAFGLRQVENGLSKTMREDQEVVIKVMKIFAAKKNHYGAVRSSVKVTDPAGNSARFILSSKFIKQMGEKQTYWVSGMKNIGGSDSLLFAETRDTRVIEIADQDVDWDKFRDETTKAKVLFIADIKQLEVCLAHRIAADICEFCKSSAGYQKTVWTMSGLIVAEAIDSEGDKSLNLFVDGPTLFRTDKKFNNLNKIHSAAEKIVGQTFIIDFDNFSGQKYAALMSEIEDQD